MRISVPWTVLLTLSMAGFGCASHTQGTGEEAATPAQSIEESVRHDPDERLLTGSLDRTVEAGGWILKSVAGEHLLLSSSSYQQKSWFSEGSRVEVWGREVSEEVTIHMQGTPFRVTSMAPLSATDQR